MDSGSPTSVFSDLERGQRVYDEFVKKVGCVDADDGLECLRKAPFTVIKSAMDASPGIYDFQVCAIHIAGYAS